MRFLSIQRHEHQIVHNHQIGSHDPVHPQLGVPRNLLRFQQLQELIHGGEADVVPLIQRLNAQCDRQMRFSYARRAEEEQVVMLFQPDQFPRLLQLTLSDAVTVDEMNPLD